MFTLRGKSQLGCWCAALWPHSSCAARLPSLLTRRPGSRKKRRRAPTRHPLSIPKTEIDKATEATETTGETTGDRASRGTNKSAGMHHLTRRSLGGSVLLFVALAVLGYVFWFHGTQRNQRASLRRVRTILNAIYEYKRTRGLWPQYATDLRELLPDAYGQSLKKEASGYLVASYVSAVGEWHYQWHRGRGFSLYKQCQHAESRPGPAYVVKHEAGLYDVQTSEDLAVVPFRQVLNPNADCVRRRLSEFGRRIRREPSALIHWRGAISLLVHSSRFAEARNWADDCRHVFPDHWWPRLSLAVVRTQ